MSAFRRHTLGELRREERERTETAACLGIAFVLVLFASSAISYAYGRSVESALTLDAFGMANHATELLRQYIPVGEAALAACIKADDSFRTILERDPIWGPRVLAMMAERPKAQ